MITPKFRATIKNRKLVILDKEGFQRWLVNLGKGNVEVIIRRPRKEKSNQQLAYLYSVIYPPISKYTEMTIEEVDYAMKIKFALNHKTKIPTIKLKQNMTTLELSDLIEKIKEFAVVELGLNISNTEIIDLEI